MSDRVFRKIYTYLVIFSLFRNLSVRKSACVNICWFSGLDSSSKSQMYTLFSVRLVGALKRCTDMVAPYLNLRKTIRTISKVWKKEKAQDSKECLPYYFL